MNGQMISAIFFALPLGAMCGATDCLSWQTYNSASMCCDTDATKCGGSTAACAAGTYKDTSKDNKVISNDMFSATCCTAVPTCETPGITCGSGYKKKMATNPATMCTGGPSNCDMANPNNAICCELDTNVCAGHPGATCEADKYVDPLMAMNTGVSTANFPTKCCTAKATCDEVTCSAGFMKIANVAATTKCAGSAAGCKEVSNCCVVDETKCGGNNVDCGAGKMQDPSKAATAIGTDKMVTCCKTTPVPDYAQACVIVSPASGAQMVQWKAVSVVLAIVGCATALWK